tara:strand:+ start:3561 stop:4661 length:1101 start_codon:yes stop_codon:yes gene_type:complete
MYNFKKTFNKKVVVVTGHSGFKGAWLSLWLHTLGAKVIGISLNEPSKPSLYKEIKLKKKIIHKKIDIKNLNKVRKTFKIYKPDFIFHLAAQSLVKKSYLDPVNTWQTNTIGTLNILESLKKINKKCCVVMITSDKSYKNLEISRGYKENDILGGIDPYSASKSSAEIAIESYTKSFFSSKQNKTFLSVGRAGNVIGGGDWSADRLVPDLVRSWSKNKKVLLRQPNSTRPWQHVLEAACGYMMLAQKLSEDKKFHKEAFNFGPGKKNNYKVIDLLKILKKSWPNINWNKKNKSNNFQESKLLKLNSDKAHKLLQWKCILNFEETIDFVANWYFTFYKRKINMFNFSVNQIKRYEFLLKKRLKKKFIL